MREEYDTSTSNKNNMDTSDYPNHSLEKNIGQYTQPYTFIISLLISFTLGSVLILAATLLWHSNILMNRIPSVLEDCPMVKLAFALCRRSRRRGGLMLL